MVAHFIMRAWSKSGISIWLHRKSRQIRFLFSEKTYFTSYLRNMFWATILYKYHENNPDYKFRRRHYTIKKLNSYSYLSFEFSEVSSKDLLKFLSNIHFILLWTEMNES